MSSSNKKPPKKPAQVKAPPPSAAKQAQSADQIQSILQNSNLPQDQIDSILANYQANQTDAIAAQHTDSFLKSLQNNPEQLKRWQQQLAAWQNSLGKVANYTSGYLDDNTRNDTAAVMKFLALNPGKVTDEWDAVGRLTQSAQDSLSQQNAQLNAQTAKVTGASVFRPAAQEAVDAGIDAAFQKAWGRDPTPQQRDAFTSSFRNIESQNFNTSYNAVNSGATTAEVPQTATPEEMTYEGIKSSPEAFGYSARQAAITLGDIIRAGH